MSQYRKGRPSQDVRLRNWNPGQANVMKQAVQQLEEAVNQLQPASIEQSARRKFSNQVPFPLALEALPGYRQVEVRITRPPGIGAHPRRQLLFYEIQYGDPGFANPTILQAKQTNFTIGGLGLGDIISIRARIVNTLNEVGPWSETRTVQVAQSQIQQTVLPDVSIRLEAAIGTWQTILAATFQPVQAECTLQAAIALCTPSYDVAKRGPLPADQFIKTLWGGPASAQFRWRVGNLNQQTGKFDTPVRGQRTLISAQPSYTAEVSDRSSVKHPIAFGTFMSPFFRLTPGVIAKVILEASLTPGSQWRGPLNTRAFQTSDPFVFTRNGQIIEVLDEL